MYCFIRLGRCYLTGRHQVKGVQQEETEALNEEHVVAVFPHQEEGHAGGTHGEIAKHLQGKTVFQVNGGGLL